jgi:hypothetical protein
MACIAVSIMGVRETLWRWVLQCAASSAFDLLCVLNTKGWSCAKTAKVQGQRVCLLRYIVTHFELDCILLPNISKHTQTHSITWHVSFWVMYGLGFFFFLFFFNLVIAHMSKDGNLHSASTFSSFFLGFQFSAQFIVCPNQFLCSFFRTAMPNFLRKLQKK